MQWPIASTYQVWWLCLKIQGDVQTLQTKSMSDIIETKLHVDRLLGTTLANAHIIRPGVFELQLLIYVLGEIMNETK